MKATKSLLIVVLASWAASAAGQSVVTAEGLPDRWFVSPEVWANPWENWGIADGEIVTTHPSPNRMMTLQHLTLELGGAQAPAEMSVTVRLKDPKGGKEGSAGFVVGVRVDDPIDDYRSRLLFGDGLAMGIGSKGRLFIGEGANADLAKGRSLGEKAVRLTVTMTPSGADTFTILLVARDAESGKRLGRVEKKNVPAARLTGNAALFTNAPSKESGCGRHALWAFRDWRLAGDKFTRRPDRAFGPILWSQYTLSKGVLKLTAQLAPIGVGDSQTVTLQTRQDGAWKDAASARVISPGWTAPFRIEGWGGTVDVPYRLVWAQRRADGSEQEHFWEGTVRRDPVEEDAVSAAVFCCFTEFLFPNRCIAENTARQNPDMLMFVGDQIYENVGGWGILRTGPVDRMSVNYLRKLALWGWSFRDVMKDRPTITMPDDHDVYHGNLWGDAGKRIELKEWNSPSGYGNSKIVGNAGGYVQPIEFLHVVERTQTSHLPDPVCTKTFKQGLPAYFTAMTYGGLGFAILEDRKFKTGPMQIAHRHEGPRPDHISQPAMANQVDDPDAEMLGDDQEAFLREWTMDWRGQQMKFAVSQTVYCGVATHHGAFDSFLLGDMDCGGWPQAGRDRAVDILRRGGVMLLAGDQHLPSLVRHGIYKPGDAIVSFVTPAGATGYQRWWRPDDVGIERLSGGRHDGRANTGIYRDGFGNLIDVLAIGNPPPSPKDARSREEQGMMKSAGWGLVVIDKPAGTVRTEAWRVRRGLNVAENARPDDQFPGWPMTFAADESFGVSAPKLPTVVIEGGTPSDGEWPVVRVTDADGEFVSMGRMQGPRFTPTVYEPGKYTVEVLSTKDDATPIETFPNVQHGDEGQLKVGL
ncbi:MAG: hypothetical protein GY851_34835 [bacterium]|nr:hypothetical protein [bacterium]